LRSEKIAVIMPPSRMEDRKYAAVRMGSVRHESPRAAKAIRQMAMPQRRSRSIPIGPSGKKSAATE